MKNKNKQKKHGVFFLGVFVCFVFCFVCVCVFSGF